MSPTDKTDQARVPEGFVELSDQDILEDDPDRIEEYRSVALAEGLQVGTEEEVNRAWQWLSDHPEFTSGLEEWFQRRVEELKEMGRIK
jgi:hypothetical protein